MLTRILLSVALVAFLPALSVADDDAKSAAKPRKSAKDADTAKKDAPKKESSKKPAEPKITGRLPAYYSQIVTDQQRAKIYAIQAKHNVTIAALKAALREAVEKRNSEVEALLTAEQRKQLQDVIHKSREERKKAAAARKGSSKEPPKKGGAKKTTRAGQ